MSYVHRFSSVDGFVTHLNGVIPALKDPFLQTQYVGFLCVSVVTVFELCIKDLFLSFAEKKHKSFGRYCSNVFDKMNGRVMIRDLRELHIKRFGDKYVSKFDSEISSCENANLSARGLSIRSSYGNVVVWRNSFAHEGSLPANASYLETCRGYESGKLILECLGRAMVR